MRSRFKERIYKIWNPTSSLQLDDVFLSNLVSRNRINPVFFNQLLHDIIGHYGLAEKENLYFFEKERDFLRSLQISAPSSVRQHVVSDGAHVAMLKMSISTNSDFKNTCLAALLLPGSESGISVNFTSIRSFSFSVFSEIGHSTFWFWNYVFKNLLDTWNGLLYSTPTFFFFIFPHLPLLKKWVWSTKGHLKSHRLFQFTCRRSRVQLGNPETRQLLASKFCLCNFLRLRKFPTFALSYWKVPPRFRELWLSRRAARLLFHPKSGVFSKKKRFKK